MRPTRVLHIIDGLGGGGSERMLWDIVRLSDPQQVQHRVVTVYPDTDIYDYENYVYSERLRHAGVYLEQAERRDVSDSQSGPGLERAEVNRIAQSLKRPLRPLWQAAKATYKHLRKTSSPIETESSEIVLPAKGEIDSERLPADSHLAIGVTLEPEVKRSLYEIVLPDAVRQLTVSYIDFRPDVIHGHTFYGFGLGIFLKLMFRRPLVFTVPCLFSQLEDAGVGYLPELYKNFHNCVDRFLSSYPAELLDIGVPTGRITPLNLVVDLEEVGLVQAERDRHRAEVRKAAGIPESALVALSVGRLHSSKGHQYALETLPFLVTRFPDLHWIVIGKASDEEERAVVQTMAIELGVDERVHILGFVE